MVLLSQLLFFNISDRPILLTKILLLVFIIACFSLYIIYKLNWSKIKLSIITNNFRKATPRATAFVLVGLIAVLATQSFLPSVMARQPLEQSALCSNLGSLPWLKTDGKWIEDENNNPVTLRGMSFCGFNNAWGEKELPDFQQKISKVTNGVNGWYPNLLRLPIQRDRIKDFTLEEIYQTLKAGVDECVRQKVYCIVDWHPVDGEKNTDWRSPQMDQETREFWSYIAPRFKNYSNVLFEVYNEPGYPKAVTAENWLNWRDKAQKWVDLIRENAPNNIILISSPLWAQITQFAAKYPFKGTNLAYVNHTYPGMKESWPRDVGMEYDWEKVFGKAADSVPMFITEFGWQATGDWEMGQGTISNFGQPMKNFLNNRPNINWVIWTYDHYCSPRLADENGKVREGESEMGGFVRDWLQEEWAKNTNPVQPKCGNYNGI
jgi:endoglucanase